MDIVDGAYVAIEVAIEVAIGAGNILRRLLVFWFGTKNVTECSKLAGCGRLQIIVIMRPKCASL